MKYRFPKASTQFIHTPSVCGLLWFGWFGVFPDHHIPPYVRLGKHEFFSLVMHARAYYGIAVLKASKIKKDPKG